MSTEVNFSSSNYRRSSVAIADLLAVSSQAAVEKKDVGRIVVIVSSILIGALILAVIGAVAYYAWLSTETESELLDVNSTAAVSGVMGHYPEVTKVPTLP